MVSTIIVLGILLIVSLVLNVIFFRAGHNQLDKVDLYESWISEFRQDVHSTFENIREIDQKQMFEKDDEVGVIFQQIFEIIEKLDRRTQDLDEDTEGENNE